MVLDEKVGAASVLRRNLADMLLLAIFGRRPHREISLSGFMLAILGGGKVQAFPGQVQGFPSLTYAGLTLPDYGIHVPHHARNRFGGSMRYRVIFEK